jgi:hypothetical protein
MVSTFDSIAKRGSDFLRQFLADPRRSIQDFYHSSQKRSNIWSGVFLGLASILTVSGVAILVSRSDSLHYFTEYYLKFLPFLLNASPADWFDTWAMGDPRPRILNVAATALDIAVRGAFSGHLYPTFGISWAIYPLTILLIFLAARKIEMGRAGAFVATLIWAASPGALDSLVFRYAPAKALMNFWFALTLLLAATLYSHARDLSKSLWTGFLVSVALAAVLLLAWFTDETTILIGLALGILFFPLFFLRLPKISTQIFAWIAGIGSILIFVFVAVNVYPSLNLANGQLPLRYFDVVVNGPQTNFDLPNDSHSKPFRSTHFAGSQLERWQPFTLLYTCVTAQLIPFREVHAFVTYSNQLFDKGLPISEFILLVLILILAILAYSRIRGSERTLAFRLALCCVFVPIVNGLLLLPVAPCIVEINYYGELFSMPYALLVGVLIFPRHGISNRSLWGGICLCLLVVCQFLSYRNTLQRLHDFDVLLNGSGDASISTLNQRNLVSLQRWIDGDADSRQLDVYPFPSSALAYGFELAMYHAKRSGAEPDFLDGFESKGIYLDLLRRQQDWLIRSRFQKFGPLLPQRDELLKQGAFLVESDELFTIRQSGRWHLYGDFFEWIADFGKGTLRIMPRSILRVKQRSVRFEIDRNKHSLVIIDQRSGLKREFTFIKLREYYYGVDATGRVVFELSDP